jgi:deoxycytidine triphosphate deaminase
MGDEPITLKTDTRIAQLVFQYTDRPTTGYDGSYNGQIEPTPAKDL